MHIGVTPRVSLNDTGLEVHAVQMATVSPVDVVAVVLYSNPTSHTHASGAVEPAVYVVDPKGHTVQLVDVDAAVRYDPTGHNA